MKQYSTKSAGIDLLIVGILAFLAWGIFSLLFLPNVAALLLEEYSDMQQYYLPCLIYFEGMGCLFLASIVFHFLLCRNILKGQALCRANEKYLTRMALCLCGVALQFFLLPVLLPEVGILTIALAVCGIISFALAVVLWALSRIVRAYLSGQEA